MTYARGIQVAGATAGGLAVALGAFGAHALQGVLDERALAVWHTAVEYQFWHALAALVAGALSTSRTSAALRVAGSAFLVGIALFCASLYALALGAPAWIGAITPLGGVAFLVGWAALAVHAARA